MGFICHSASVEYNKKHIFNENGWFAIFLGTLIIANTKIQQFN